VLAKELAMRTKFSRLLVLPLFALALQGGAVAHGSAQQPTIVSRTTTTAPNGDKITTLTFSDGTVMRVIVTVAGQNFNPGSAS
jgi:hypothetical protein